MLLLLTGASWGQTNLLRNPDLMEAPEANTLPGFEDHAGALVVHLPAGNTQIPGWKIVRPVELAYWKGSRLRTFGMQGSGAVAQTLSLVPKRKYRLTLRVLRDQEGPANQILVVKIGSDRRELPAGGGYELMFTVDSPQTTLELSGRNATKGPGIRALVLTEWNPDLQAAQTQLTKLYAALDRAQHRNTELDQALAILAEDFKFQPLTGEAQDKAAFLQAATQLAAQKKDLLSTIQGVTLTPGGAEVTIERKSSGDDGTGKRVAVKTLYKDVWAKSGETWTWKSSTEQEAPSGE